MDDLLINQLLPVLSGAISTGLAWLAKAIYSAKRDIDYAHEKIRELEETVQELKCQQSERP